MTLGSDDSWDLAAAQILARLNEEEGIEFVSSRGVQSLTGPLAAFLLRLTESGQDGRADALADWLMDQQEVADLFASDEDLEGVLREEWDPLVVKVDGKAVEQVVRNARNEELEQLLQQDPDNIELYLVYGDWLKEQGDPLGQLMSAQAVLAVDPTPENQQAAEDLMRENQDYFLGRLVEAPQAVGLEWHLGFIRSARLWLPRGRQDEIQGAALLGWLLELPTARFLRELQLGPFDHRGADQYADMVQVLLSAERPTLQGLTIGVTDFDVDASWSDAGNLTGLERALPELRRLEVHAGHVVLDEELELPWLEELTLEIEHMSPGTLAAVAGARLPFLERLELRTTGREALHTDPQQLVRLLAGEGLPVLEELALPGADELVQALVEAPLLEQIQRLDLSDGALTDGGAATMAAHAGRFKHLERLDVSGNRLSAAGTAQLRGLCPDVALEDQQEPGAFEEEPYEDPLE